MGIVRHAVTGLLFALVVIGCSEGVQIPKPDDSPQACSNITDCRTGQGCLQGVCAELPCGGRCTLDEACVRNACIPVDGLDCAGDPTLCPRGFLCSEADQCQRSCTTDRDCTSPGFNSCNVETGLCGECTFNGDCGGPTPVCDSKKSKCVECVEHKDCGQGTGQVCDEISQTCATGCKQDDECGPGLRCQGGTPEHVGRCIECEVATESNDCSTSDRPRCNPQTLRCVACVGNDDCLSNQCNTRASQCVECVQNEYCDKGHTCDLDVFQCFEGCGGPSGGPNCPPEKPACDKAKGERGTCVECLQDGDCGWGKVCKKDAPGGPICVEGCKAGTTGAANDGRCATPPAGKEELTICDPSQGGYGRCVQCRGDEHCPSTQKCDGALKICRCKTIGETCGGTSECGYQVMNGTPNCDATRPLCVTQVTCGSQTRNVSAPECTVASSKSVGDAGTGGFGDCPVGYTTRQAKDALGGAGKQCVRNALCQ